MIFLCAFVSFEFQSDKVKQMHIKLERYLFYFFPHRLQHLANHNMDRSEQVSDQVSGQALEQVLPILEVSIATVDINLGDDEEGTLDSFSFKISSGPLTAQFEVGSPYQVSDKQWEIYLATMKLQTKAHKQYASVSFEDSNGQIDITSVGGETTFQCSKYGGNGCGSCQFTIPNQSCFDAFEKVIATLKADHKD